MVLTRYILMALIWTMLAGISNAYALSSIKATTTGDGNYTITVADIQDLVAIDVTLSYDTGVLSNPRMQSGAFASAAYMEANTTTPGTVRAVYMYTTDGAFNGAGQLATLTFTLAGATKGCLKDLNAVGYPKSGSPVAIQPVIECQQNLAAATDSAATAASTQTPAQSAPPAATSFKVTPLPGAGGSMNPPDAQMRYSGSSTSFTLTPATGYQISGASGCGGTLNGSVFTTGPISADCAVTASFSQIPPPAPSAETQIPSPDSSAPPTATASGSMGTILNQAAAQQAAQLAAANSGKAIVNGACGASNNQLFASAPSTALCSTGTAGSVTGNGPWSWSCTGSNGGTNAACTALLQINGACGNSNNKSFTSAPSSDLCSSGTAGSVTGSGPWSWSCTGSNGGAVAACSASFAQIVGGLSVGGTVVTNQQPSARPPEMDAKAKDETDAKAKNDADTKPKDETDAKAMPDKPELDKPAADKEETDKTEAKPVSDAIAKLKTYASPLHSFKTFKGKRQLSAYVPLFKKVLDTAVSQDPAIAVSDGKTPLRLKLVVDAPDASPGFAFNGASIKNLRKSGNKTWFLEIVPLKGEYDVVMFVKLGDSFVEVPLVVVPELDRSVMELTGGLSEKGVDELLSRTDTPDKPAYDLNGDGKRDYVDDYILVAHYLLKNRK